MMLVDNNVQTGSTKYSNLQSGSAICTENGIHSIYIGKIVIFLFNTDENRNYIKQEWFG